MFEGTGKYFTVIILIFILTFITVKICMYFIFKTAKLKGYKALIPFTNRKILIETLELDKKIFFKTLIPFVNLYYYNIIIKKLLEAYKIDPKESIRFILIPMYKFPELVFKKPIFTLNMYNETERFLDNQKALFEKENTQEGKNIYNETPNFGNVNNYNNVSYTETPNYNINHGANNYNQTSNYETNINYNEVPNYNSTPIPDSVNYNQNINNQNYNIPSNNEIPDYIKQVQNTSYNREPDETSIFTNDYRPDERKEKYFEAQKQTETKKAPIQVANVGRPIICPNCGAKLAHDATVCFLCGHKLK